MRVLAIDPGSRRIGIAISDELGMLAHPLEFIEAEPFEAFFLRLQVILREKHVELVLVGLPRNMDGTYGPAAEKVRAFVARLASVVTVPVRTWDERLTSVQADRLLRQAGVRGRDRRNRIDQMAAAVLLQSYLDSQSS